MEQEKQEPNLLLPVLPRLDRLDRLVQLLEEKHSLSLRHSSNPVAREMEQQDQCKTLYSALEEVHHKGTLIERLAILENRVLQLSVEMDDGNTSRSSSSTALVSGHDSSVSKVSRRDNDEILINQETEYHPPSIQEDASDEACTAEPKATQNGRTKKRKGYRKWFGRFGIGC